MDQNNTNNNNFNNNIIHANNERHITHSQNVDSSQDECENVKDIWKNIN